MRRGAGPAIGTSGPRRRPPTRLRCAPSPVITFRNLNPTAILHALGFISRQFRFRFGESVQLMFLQTDFGELQSVFVDERVL